MKSISSELKYIPELDGLRAIAILLVLFVHFFSVSEQVWLESNIFLSPLFYKIILFGAQGVELFFLLSGYLITKILLSSISSRDYFKTFFMRRFLRIFPLYYMVLFLSFVIYPLFIPLPPDAHLISQEQWKLWAYLSNVHFFHYVMWDTPDFFNFGHFWTLSVEEHFYLIWPFLIFFTANKRLEIWMWSIFAISLLSWLIGMKIDFFNWTTLTHSGGLALGGLIAYYEYTNPVLIKTISQWLKKHFYLVILFIAIAIFLPRSLGYIQKFSSHLFSIAGFSSILLIILYHEISFLKINWLIFIGKISYGIYVYHALLRPFFKQYIYLPLQEMFPNENGLLVILMYTSVSIIFSILIAWISWELYEKQVLKFKKYFSYTASSKNKGL